MTTSSEEPVEEKASSESFTRERKERHLEGAAESRYRGLIETKETLAE